MPGGPPASDEATVDHVEIKAELCRWLDRCRPQELALFYGGDVESCIAYQRCVDSAPVSSRVTEDCIQAIRDVDCDGDVVSVMHQSSVCEPGGPLPFAEEGERCDYWVCRGVEPGLSTRVYCDDGLYCGNDGVCVPLAQEGDACSINDGPGTLQDSCEPYMHCDISDWRCDADLPPGAPCAIQTTPNGKEIDPCGWKGPCMGGFCADFSQGEPVPGLPEGEACEPYTEACLLGLACADRVCQEIICDGEDGAPCARGSCADALVCNDYAERCEVRGPDCGEYDENCEVGEFCNLSTFTCQPIP